MTPTPLFIFSLPRSGSTLLQRMLSGHFDIQTESELWFLLPHVEAVKNKISCSTYSTNTLADSTKHLLGQLPDGENSYYRAIRKLSDKIFNDLNPNGSKYLLDKTPRYYFIIEEIEKIYPDAKFIFLFRHPMSCLASTINSFYKGRLGDYRHKVDIIKGPEMLASGYRTIQEKSIAVQYENLVHEPEATLKSICEYLSISFTHEMMDNFSSVKVTGLGDQYGSSAYDKVESSTIEKWKTTFTTPFRKKYALNVLRNMGPETTETFGYGYDEILRDIESMPVTFSFSLRDRYNEMRSAIYSKYQIPLVRKSKKQAHTKDDFFIYH